LEFGEFWQWYPADPKAKDYLNKMKEAPFLLDILGRHTQSWIYFKPYLMSYLLFTKVFSDRRPVVFI